MRRTGEPYSDLGGDYFDKRRNNAARQRRRVAQPEAMGHRVPSNSPTDQNPPNGAPPRTGLRPRTPPGAASHLGTDHNRLTRSHRCAAVNLKRLLALGLGHNSTAWTVPTA